MLTVLGIILGFFISALRGSQHTIDSYIVLLTGFATSISMLVSGLSGSYISEKAEQRKLKIELDKAMVFLEEELKNEEDIESENLEIEKAMITVNINRKNGKKKKIIKNQRIKEKKVKTVQEKAERFASVIVSIVNGGAPFLGGTIPLIPFFLTEKAGLFTFINSFLIIFVCIVLLGILIGYISQESIFKNILQMLAAFGITMVISILLLH